MEKKRGLFRRRKNVEVESAVETELEDTTDFESDAEPEDNPWYVPAVEDEEPAEQEIAASSEDFEAPAEEPKKRGLFRRRKSAPVEEPVAEDADAELLEDESFENVTYWGSEVSDDVEQAEEPVSEPEADTYVYGEDESQAEDAPVESEPAEEHPRTPPTRQHTRSSRTARG